MAFYDDYLRSGAWRALREQVFARDGGRCVLCNHAEDLEVHHRTYERLGKENLNDLTTLCRQCHDVVTDHQRRQRYTTRDLPTHKRCVPLLPRRWSLTYKDVAHEASTGISPGWGVSSLTAQWQLQHTLNVWAKAIKKISDKRKKTEADHLEMGRLEWHGSLYLHEGAPCIPLYAIKATLLRAATTLRKGPKVKAGVVCEAHAPLLYDGPTDPKELWEDERFRFRSTKALNGRRVVRTRPMFFPWSADVIIVFNDEAINPGEVDELMAIAGHTIGLLEERPEYGRFRVHKI